MKASTDRRIKTILFAVLLTLFLAAGLGLAARYDLAVDQALRPLWLKGLALHEAGKGSVWYTWAVAAETLAPWPPYLGLTCLGWCLCAAGMRRPRGRAVRYAFGAVLLAGSCLAISLSTFSALQKREALASGLPLRIGAGLGAAVLLVLWALYAGRPLPQGEAPQGRIGSGNLLRWTTLSLFWAGMAAGQLAATQLLKAIWQRTRFDDMMAAGDLSGFTSWLTVPGNGGNSFPSGHTASAGVLLILVVACRLFDSCRDDEAGFLFAGYLFAAAVAFGRMLIGRHYLSDTLAAIAVDSILLALACWLPGPAGAVRHSAVRAAQLDSPAVPKENK